MEAERTAQENQAEVLAKLKESDAHANDAEARASEAERELTDAKDALGRSRERADLERRLAEATSAAVESRKAADRLAAELERTRRDAEHAREVAQERAAAEDAERQNRLESERQLEEVLSDGRRQEEAVATVERRIAEALDRRLKATVESGTRSGVLIKKQEATITAHNEEIAHLEQRITAARNVLSELAQMGDDRQQEQSVLADRLDQIAQVLGNVEGGDQQQPPPPPPPAANGNGNGNGSANANGNGNGDAAPELSQALRKRGRRARA